MNNWALLLSSMLFFVAALTRLVTGDYSEGITIWGDIIIGTLSLNLFLFQRRKEILKGPKKEDST